MRKNFMTLEVWKRAHLLVLEIYKSAEKVPEDEQEGLAFDLRTAAMAVPATIAHGCGREDEDEFREFLGIALDSAKEVEYDLLLLRDLGHMTDSEHERLKDMTIEVKTLLTRMLSRRPGSKD